MVMLLPFLLGTLAVWFGLRGRRSASFAFWLLTLALFVATLAGQWDPALFAGLRI